MTAAQTDLRLFTRVKISAEGGIPSCIGRIEDIRPVEESSDVPRSILSEWGVTRVALISYHAYPSEEYMFAALEMGGKWYDHRRQELVLEVVGQSTRSKDA